MSIKLDCARCLVTGLLVAAFFSTFVHFSYAGTVLNPRIPAAYSTIQEALINAQNGDPLYCEGLFNEHDITWEANNVTLVISPAATVPATIDAQSQGSVINLLSAVSLSIEGITLCNGRNTTSSLYGGAVSLVSGSSLNLEDVIIRNCSSEGNPCGAIYANGSSVRVDSCLFEGNRTTAIGGVGEYGTWEILNSRFIGNFSVSPGGVFYQASGNIVNSTFADNAATTSIGGVFMNGSWNISSSEFSGNSASGGGGVVYGAAAMNMFNCTFEGNSGGGTGGGVAYSGTVVATNCSFTNNSGLNGGVFYTGALTAFDCDFSGNIATQGGGISWSCDFRVYDSVFKGNLAYQRGGCFASGSTVNAYNCIFSGNRASLEGGVTYFDNANFWNCSFHGNNAPNSSIAKSNSAFHLYNSIIWGNDVSGHLFQMNSYNITTVYSDIQPNSDKSPGTGDISAEPLFISTFESSDDFMKLAPGSPCIDYASMAYAPAFDFAGNVRPHGPNPDMGVYEFQGPSISVEYPNGGEELVIDTAYTIRWIISADSVAGDTYVRLSTDEGVSWTELTHKTAQLGENTFLWTPEAASNVCFISVEATAGGGLFNIDTSNSTFSVTTEMRSVYVSPHGNDTTGHGTVAEPFLTVNKAFDYVRPGGFVYLMNGIHTVEGAGYNVTWPDKGNVTLTISPGAVAATMDAQGLGRIVSVEAPVSLGIESIIMRRGLISGYGGAIRLVAGSTLELDNVLIALCTADAGGGAVDSAGCVINASHCTFINNNTGGGGGVALGGTWNATNCAFSSNRAVAASKSGGVFASLALNAFDCTFEGNSADRAGAIYSGILYLFRCTFNNNSAQGPTYGGGGIFYSSTVYASGCAFTGNNAVSGGGVIEGGSTTAVNCIFSRNRGGTSGGVTYQGGAWNVTNCIFNRNSASIGGVVNFAVFDVNSCTFYGNTAETGGVLENSNWNSVFNSIFCGNQATSSGPVYGSSVTFAPIYCNIQPDGYISGTGNISAEPRLTSTSEPYDFHLLNGSPCIDTGTNEGAPSFDMDGNPRPFPPGSRVDMGAYESSTSEGPAIDAVYVNGKTFFSGGVVSRNVDMRVLMHSNWGVASAEVQVDPTGTPVILAFSSGTTFEGQWICSFTIPYSSSRSQSYLFIFTLTDGAGNQRTESWTAVVIGGEVQVIGNPMNYPNPFAPLSSDASKNATTIQYVLSRDAPVTLYIYDITGHEVKRMGFASGAEGGRAGINQITWDGKSIFNEVAGNGMYIYRIVSDRKVLATSKLVIFDK